VIVFRVPCSSGDEIVTVTPGNGLPSAETTPPSDALICANALTAKNDNAQDSAATALFILIVSR
jgi:hypothetical protein